MLALTCFGVNNHDTRVYCLNSSSHVVELAFIGGGFVHNDVTNLASAPPAAAGSALTCFGVNNHDTRVYYLGSDGHVHELAFTGDRFVHNDVSFLASSPPAAAGSALTCFGVNNHDTRVYYLGSDGHVHELAFTEGGFVHNDLTKLVSAFPANAFTALTCFGVNNTDSRVYYLDSNNHVAELAFTRDGGLVGRFVHNDVTNLAQPTPVPVTVSLTCFGVNNFDPRVYYLEKDGNVHELAFTFNPPRSTWANRSVTDLASAPPAFGGSALTCFGVNNTDSRVYYLDSAGDVHELAFTGGRFVHHDVSSLAGAPPAAIDSALTCFGVNNTDSRVYYLGSDGHVHELAFTGNRFVHNDLQFP